MRQPLGQHFLRDPKVIQTILTAAELQPTDTALEIGPGKGVLTDPLLQRVHHLTAVELDRVLAAKLESRFAGYPNFKLIPGDFLKTNLDQLFPQASPPAPLLIGEGSPKQFPLPSGEGGPRLSGVGEAIKVLGNIPYAITSPIFEKILAWPGWLTGVFLIQKEVGERMRSHPGSKTFGILSLAVQVFAEVESIASVPPGAFTPPPRVHSMVIRLRRKRVLPLPEASLPDFFDLAHAAFSHRRKTLANSLAFFSKIPKKKVEAWLAQQQVNANARAETLGLDQYVKLTVPWAIFRREINLT
jgi:16S rRNA (adenine1518-N6/adenine1519-N6)-dimethyltransferase